VGLAAGAAGAHLQCTHMWCLLPIQYAVSREDEWNVPLGVMAQCCQAKHSWQGSATLHAVQLLA
jgi:hypothetical protein